MTFYDCRDFIVEQIIQYLKGALREKGLTTAELTKQHNELRANFIDLYSRSLLMKGAPQEDAPTFVNVPYAGFYPWDVRERLDEVFEILDLPNTQAALHGFWLKLKRGSIETVLTEQQKENLTSWRIFTHKAKDISDWLVRARHILAIMTFNIPLAQIATEEEKVFGESLHFDWYYSYSDQASTWRAGEAKHKEVGTRVKQILAEKPHLKKVVETVAAAHNLGPGFFTYTGK